MTSATSNAGHGAKLSPELSEFLIELSIGVHRYSMYPPDHPTLRPAIENLVFRLSRLFAVRARVDIGVAQKQLLVDGMATDARHPVLNDLAHRLHEHQLVAVSIHAGVTAEELAELLATLAAEAEHGEDPAGQRPALPAWPHIRLHVLGYDQLELVDGAADGDGAPDRASRLWFELARAALGSDAEESAEWSADSREIARTISRHKQEEAYDQVIVRYMLQLADELRNNPGAEARHVRSKVTGLIREMDENTLDRLIRMGGNVDSRKQFVLDANEALSVDAVMKVLHSAASASEQTVSTSMTRMLTKLSMHAEKGSATLRAHAGSALRENVEELIGDWDLKDPNPDSYTRALDTMARASPVFGAVLEEGEPSGDDGGGEVPGALRLLQMAIEVDAWGPTVAAAVHDLLHSGRGGDLFDLLDSVDHRTSVVPRIRSYLADPDRARSFFQRSELDERGLDGIVLGMGSTAIEPLLDVLLTSESRSVRRRIFDRIVRLGPEVVEPIRARLAAGLQWYVIRNLLAVLARLPGGGVGAEVEIYLQHEDARVRREAFALLFRASEQGTRERALARSLADPDDRIVGSGLQELKKGVPDSVLPTVVARVVSADRDEELRAMAMQVLRGVRKPLARRALIDVLVGRDTSIFRKTKLAEISAPVLAALEALAVTWPDDPEVVSILEMARRSRHEEIRAAAEAG